ncbi:hypothetical protein IFM89_000083 [Coptis chinensis]|uniref:Wax synthase domain-containing protein n=1 Tax=Coptis chinensis TaxID=261450 RepID=A0A835M1Y5_9MAGN|nr:hypothetical protein IFM89_000083 [Coptis chinensis]
MEGEIRSFIKAWAIVSASLTYCYFISSRIPKGKFRLLSILPIISIFTFLPLCLSSFFLQFYFGPNIGWLANFKLILFAFGKDDTLSINPSTSLLHFIVAVAFPVRIKPNSSQRIQNKETPSTASTKQDSKLNIIFVINVLIWAVMVQAYANNIVFKQETLFMKPIVAQFLYSARMLFGTQVMFVLQAALAEPLIRQETEPQFNEPYLSTSLQDFWGKRWNRTVNSLLKYTIFQPTKSLLTPIFGKRWTIHLAILATFVVSGLMHELMHFYVGRQWPTWEVMWFFVIHGVCLAIELEVKKKALKHGWRLHWMISLPLTVGFVVVTGIWLCYTELINFGADIREVEEYVAFINYVKNTLHDLGAFTKTTS